MFSELCTPARIYLVIAIIASIFALFRGIPFGAVFMQMFFVFIWAYFLGWLCTKGYSSVSWFLVLLPYVMIMLALLSGNNNYEGFVEGKKNRPTPQRKN